MKKQDVVTIKCDEQQKEAISKELTGLADITYLEEIEEADRAQVLKSSDVLLSMIFPLEVKREEYELLKNVSLLQEVAAGVDFLPFADLRDGITICSNAGAWADPMAEHILGMVLTLGKNLLTNHAKLARGEFERQAPSKRFRGATCGIVGFGGIGKATAALMRLLGMKIFAMNSSGRTDEPVDFIGTLGDMEKVFKACDVVIISLPLKKQSRHIIGPTQLAWMKEDAILINAARAEIIEEKALYEHMKKHPYFKVGLDVWWMEPRSHGAFSANYPFFELENLLGSPHNSPVVGGAFPEALKFASENVRLFLTGQELRGFVDRSDYI